MPTFPVLNSQDPALEATPGEHPRIMIDAPRICQDLSCSEMASLVPCCSVPYLHFDLARFHPVFQSLVKNTMISYLN
jgi:hypothetical protein